MRFLYQSEWQKIKFRSFANVSSTTFADKKFYEIFYKIFFSKYYYYNKLDKNWLKSKRNIANWISNYVMYNKNILSVGCGIGYIEYCLVNIFGKKINLYVCDNASNSHKWLKNFIPKNRIFDFSHKKIKKNFDLIYLSAVDYAMDDREFIKLLKTLKKNLSENGNLIIISASFIEEKSFFADLFTFLKYIFKRLFIRFFAKNKFQLWGFMRNRKEYLSLVERSGFNNFSHGVESDYGQPFFWIIAKVS